MVCSFAYHISGNAHEKHTCSERQSRPKSIYFFLRADYERDNWDTKAFQDPAWKGHVHAFLPSWMVYTTPLLCGYYNFDNNAFARAT